MSAPSGPSVALVWLRRDLRLVDQPALHVALTRYERVVLAFIHSDAEHGDAQPGAASRWWLHHSLAALDARLHARGNRLIIRHGPFLDALRALSAETGATAVVWSRLYDPDSRARDARIKAALRADGLECHSVNAALIHEPFTILTASDAPYKVFTPYYRAARKHPVAAPRPAPEVIPAPVDIARVDSVALAELGLRPRQPWDAEFTWTCGESAALTRLDWFVEHALARYAERRDQPAVDGTSRLSPHLHFGELSPRTVIARAQGLGEAAEPFIRQLYWRDFAHVLLYHFPETVHDPMDTRFAEYPWAHDTTASYAAWQRGETGIPLVDAGMRQLWRTGWMHNRVRMMVASFLTKNLRVPWQQGAAWFHDTLVDADLANNTMGWQWTAGCGADAAPYFRVFNPIRQAERFDPAGEYIAHWIPELARLPAPARLAPWLAGATTLAEAGVRLGTDYPAPMVDLAQSRKAALAGYEHVKNAPR